MRGAPLHLAAVLLLAPLAACDSVYYVGTSCDLTSEPAVEPGTFSGYFEDTYLNGTAAYEPDTSANAVSVRLTSAEGRAIEISSALGIDPFEETGRGEEIDVRVVATGRLHSYSGDGRVRVWAHTDGLLTAAFESVVEHSAADLFGNDITRTRACGGFIVRTDSLGVR